MWKSFHRDILKVNLTIMHHSLFIVKQRWNSRLNVLLSFHDSWTPPPPKKKNNTKYSLSWCCKDYPVFSTSDFELSKITSERRELESNGNSDGGPESRCVWKESRDREGWGTGSGGGVESLFITHKTKEHLSLLQMTVRPRTSRQLINCMRKH